MRQWSLLVLVLALIPSAGYGKSKGKPRPDTRSPHETAGSPSDPTRFALAPLRQTVGPSDTATLGEGMAESVSNALKGMSRIAVTDVAAVIDAAKQAPVIEVSGKDQDACALAERLGVQMMITGSYQVVGNQLIIDAKALNVASKRPIPGSSVHVIGRFPDEYPTVLELFTTKLITALRLPASPDEADSVVGALGASKAAKAQQLYDLARQRIRDDSRDGLKQAVRLLEEAIAADPNFALAYVSKAEAQTRLAELAKSQGAEDRAVAREAQEAAKEAVARAPKQARAQRVFSRALATSGDYDGATAAAERAVQLSPNDAYSLIALARALGRGTLARDAHLDRAFQLVPGLAFVLRDLPKVLVRNTSEHAISVRFVADDGHEYPPVSVQPGASRMVALLAGNYTVTTESDIGDLVKQWEFHPGEEAQLTFSATDVPAGIITLTNKGNATAYVSVIGPRSRQVVVAPGATETVTTGNGHYEVAISGGTGGMPLSTRAVDVKTGENEIIEFRIVRRWVTRPAYGSGYR